MTTFNRTIDLVKGTDIAAAEKKPNPRDCQISKFVKSNPLGGGGKGEDGVVALLRAALPLARWRV